MTTVKSIHLSPDQHKIVKVWAINNDIDTLQNAVNILIDLGLKLHKEKINKKAMLNVMNGE